jgi:hypothetical protein
MGVSQKRLKCSFDRHSEFYVGKPGLKKVHLQNFSQHCSNELQHNGGFCNGCIAKLCLHNLTDVSMPKD